MPRPLSLPAATRLVHETEASVFRLDAGDEHAGKTGRPPQAYAYVDDDRAIVIDAGLREHLPALQALVDAGTPPAAAVFSHGHVASGSAPAVLAALRTQGVPLLLHPADARGDSDVFGDPTRSPELEAAGLDVLPFPGHTAGSVLLYARTLGGALFTGDSAMGPGPRQDPEPPRLIRGPGPYNQDDGVLIDSWRAFLAASADRPLRHVFPYHGTAYVDRDDLGRVMGPLTRTQTSTFTD